MDGGLICQYDNVVNNSSIIVYNPIAKASIELPAAADHLTCQGASMLNLVVDNVSQQFKIFSIWQVIRSTEEGELKNPSDPFMRVYDSATNEWKSTSTYPFFGDVLSEGVGSHCSVMFQGLLYVVVCFDREKYERSGDFWRLSYELWRYHPLEDAWERVHVDIASKRSSSKLLVSANRLFVIGWFKEFSCSMSSMRSDTEQVWRLEVNELKFPGMEQERLLEMLKADVLDFFGVMVEDSQPIDVHPEIIASGFGKSLLFSSASSENRPGKSMVFDLETRLWEPLPGLPVGTATAI